MSDEAVFARYSGHEDDPDAQDRLWAELVETTLRGSGQAFDRHWDLYQSVFAERPADAGPPVAWRPDARTLDKANVTAFAAEQGLGDYDALRSWSAQERERFWDQTIRRLGIRFQRPPDAVLGAGGTAEDPKWLPGARLNIAESCFQAPADRPAIIAGKEGTLDPLVWTYGELQVLAGKVAGGLQRLGLRKGDAVALYMPMTPECVAAYLGIVMAGLAVVSIPDSFAAPEVATRLRLGDAQWVITVDSFRRAGKQVPMADKAIEAGAKRCIFVAERPPDAARPGDVLWGDLVAGRPAPSLACDPDDVTNVLFSSGTTGDPKAIPWTHMTPIKAASDGHFHQDIHPEDVVAWPTNIGWMMGPWLIYATFLNQATMALYEGVPTGEGFIRFVRDAGVSVLGVVPAIVRAWRATDLPPGSFPGVRIFSSTGEASNAQDYLYLMSLAGYEAPIIEYCGGTEIGGGHITGTVARPASPATFNTPALGLDFVILDDEGREVRPGGMGEIFLVPPSIGLSQRLLNRDHHEAYYADLPTDPRGRPLRRHGDEIHALHHGFWAAGGRADDTMNLGGIKVSSIELENAMNGHPDVLETAAVATQAPGGGADRLTVFYVPVAGKGIDEATLQQGLQARIKKRLNPLFRIHQVVAVEELPRTASNKVMRRELRATLQD